MYCPGVIPYILGYVSTLLESLILGLPHLGQNLGVGLVSFLCFSPLSTSRRFLSVPMFIRSVWLLGYDVFFRVA